MRTILPTGLFRGRPASVDIPNAGRLRFVLHRRDDIWISDAIRRGESFDPHILGVLRRLTPEGGVFLDIGANIGYFTVIGSRFVGPRGKVFAIEPDPGNLRLLRKNVALNRCSNATVLAIAAGEAERTARLYRSSDNQGDHRLEIQSDRPDSVEVPIRPLDLALADHVRRVDMVKMDTQGSEVAILRGMSGLLDASPNARIVLEFWPFGLRRCGFSADQLAEFLGRRPGSLWIIQGGGEAAEVSVPDLMLLARTTYAPETMGHADLVWLAATDRQGIEAMRARPG